MRRLSTILVLLLAIPQHSARGADDSLPPDESQQQLISVFEALRLNNTAIRSFDVLFWTEIYADRETAGYENVRKITRLIFDQDAEYCVQVSSAERELYVAPEPGAPKTGKELSQSKSLRCTVIMDGKAHWISWPGNRYSTASPNFYESLARHDVATFHMIGVTVFPLATFAIKNSDTGNHPLEFPDEAWSIFKTQWSRGSLRETRTGPKIVLPPQSSGGQYASIHEYLLDKDSLLPVSRESIRLDEANNERKRMSNEFIKWSKKEGLYLPVEYSLDRISATNFGGRTIEYEINQNHRIHWISVNSGVDKSRGPDGFLTSPERVLKLLDQDEIGVPDGVAPWKPGK